MRCIICMHGKVVPGTATVTLGREGMTLVFKHVATRICPNCGEEYIDEQASAQLMETAEQSARAGVQVDVREYAAA